MEPVIRKRRVEDSSELAHCIATVWNTTYQGIVDDSFLSGLLKSEGQNAERLKNNISEQPYYFVLTLNDKIIGWVYLTLTSDFDESAAEIQALYVLSEYQGRGYGKLLYQYAVDLILKKGISRLVIGCLAGNPSNTFYEHLNGKLVGHRMFRDTYPENIYLFTLQ